MVESQKEMAMKLGQSEGPISQMLKDDRPITLGVLVNLVDQFGVNANYILSRGRGPVLIKGEDSNLMVAEDEVPYGNRIEVLEKEIAYLKEQIASKDKIIALLERK